MSQYLGQIYYNAHAATPTVFGDFERMKAWPGEPDGEAEGPIEINGGAVFGFTAFDLASPHVFTADDGSVTLLVKEGSYGSLGSPPEGDELATLLSAPLEDVDMEEEIDVSSGALVITVAYNATPAVGAETGHLSDLCFYPGVPLLPESPPAAAEFQGELAVIPVPSGTFKIETGTIGGYERCRVSPANS